MWLRLFLRFYAGFKLKSKSPKGSAIRWLEVSSLFRSFEHLKRGMMPLHFSFS
jgi:hypothetical protein